MTSVNRFFVFSLLIVALMTLAAPIIYHTETQASQIEKPRMQLMGSIHDKIREHVTLLGYASNTADQFLDITANWIEGKREQSEVAKIKNLCLRIRSEIEPTADLKLFDLPSIMKTRRTQCVGFTQLLWILGRSMDLDVYAIEVAKTKQHFGSTPIGLNHIANVFRLSGGKLVMVDLNVMPNLLVSEPFTLETYFRKVEQYWEIKSAESNLNAHDRFRILDTDGLRAVLHNKRGIARFETGDFRTAMTEFRKATELDSSSCEAFLNLGGAYYEIGDVASALTALATAGTLDPKRPEVFINRGLLYDKLGQRNKSVAEYTKAIELNPHNATAYCRRGAVYAKEMQLETALKDLLQAISIDPNFAMAYYNRGIVRTIQAVKSTSTQNAISFYAQAATDFSKVIKIDPQNADAYFYRGIVYGSLGIKDWAKRDLEKAVMLKPSLKPSAREKAKKFGLTFEQ